MGDKHYDIAALFHSEDEVGDRNLSNFKTAIGDHQIIETLNIEDLIEIIPSLVRHAWRNKDEIIFESLRKRADKFEIFDSIMKSQTKGNRKNISITKRLFILSESIQKILDLPLKSNIRITFAEENGVDAGGVARDYFSSLAKAINDILAVKDKIELDNLTLINTVRLLGRIMGIALRMGEPLGVRFDPDLLMAITKNESQSHKLMMDEVRDLNITDHGEMCERIGGTYQDGKCYLEMDGEIGLSVSSAAALRDEYIQKFTEFRKTPQGMLKVLADALNDEIAIEYFSLFEPEELNVLLGGRLDDDAIRMLEQSAIVLNVTMSKEEKNELKSIFFEILLECEENDRKAIIQFITGSPGLPPSGRPLKIAASSLESVDPSIDISDLKLPTTHTCFFQIDLKYYRFAEEPTFDAREWRKNAIRDRLLVAARHAGGFAFI